MTTEGRPARRLRVPAAGHTPRVEELDALLKDVDDLRLALATDLSLAASAVEAGAPELAADIIDHDRDTLRRFEDRALQSLASLEDAPRRKARTASHAAPAVAAAALVAVLAGLMPQATTPSAPSVSASTAAATDSLALIQDLVARGETQEVRLASEALHLQLAAVVSRAKTDPLVAQQALLLLSYEQNAIVANGGSETLADVLVRSRRLAQAIRAALPKPLRTAVPLVAPEERSDPKPSSKPSPTATPKASAKPSPSPKPSSTPSQQPSPKPSSTTSKDGLVPPAPDLDT